MTSSKNFIKAAWGILSISVVCVLTGCGGGGENNPGTGNRVEITGRVVSADNPNQGVSGASVSISNSRATAQTDSQGNFRISSSTGIINVSIQPPDTHQGFSFSYNASGSSQMSLGELPLLPAGVTLGDITINPPAPNGPMGSYLIDQTYNFRAVLRDGSGQTLNGWAVRWRVEGGVASIDSSGNLRATSEGNGRVIAFLNFGNRTLESQPINITVKLPEDQPSFNIFASYSKSIVEYNGRTGSPIRSFGSGQLQSGRKMVLSPDRQLYICDTANNRVWRADVSTGTLSAVSSLPQDPYDVLVKPDGMLLVLTDSRLYEADPITGSYKLLFDSGSTTNGFRDMEWGPDGKVYIANASGSGFYGKSVFRIDPDGKNAEIVVRANTGSIRSPIALTFVPNNLAGGGELLVADTSNDAVYRFTSQGVLLGTAFSVKNPASLNFGPDGNLYVSIGSTNNPKGVRRYSYPSFIPVESIFISVSVNPMAVVFAENR